MPNLHPPSPFVLLTIILLAFFHPSQASFNNLKIDDFHQDTQPLQNTTFLAPPQNSGITPLHSENVDPNHQKLSDTMTANHSPRRFRPTTRALDMEANASPVPNPADTDSTSFLATVMKISKINSDAVSHTMTGLALIANILQPGNPAALLIITLSKMPKYITQTSLEFNFESEFKPKSWYSIQIPATFGPEMSESSKRSFPYHQLPEAFSREEYHSSYLVNNWGNLITFAIVLFMTGIISLIHLAWSTSEVQNSVFQHLKSALKWNIFFTIFLGSLDDLSLYSFFQFSTFKPGNTYDAISLVSCIMTIGVAFAIFWNYFKLTKNSTKPKTKPANRPAPEGFKNSTNKWDGYQIFTDGFKDDSLIGQRFPIIFLSRVFIVNMVISSLSKDPSVQFGILTFLSCAMIACIALRNPFAQNTLKYQVTLTEIIMFVMNISLLLLSLSQDKTLHTSSSFQENIEYTILTCLCLFTIIFKLFILTIFLQALRTAYLAYQAKKDAEKTAIEEEGDHSSPDLHDRNPKFKGLTVFSPGRAFLSGRENPPQEQYDNQQDENQPQEEENKTWKRLRIIGGLDITLGDSPLRSAQKKPERPKRSARERYQDVSRRKLKKNSEEDGTYVGSFEDVEKVAKTPDMSDNTYSKFPVSRNGNRYQRFSMGRADEDFAFENGQE